MRFAKTFKLKTGEKILVEELSGKENIREFQAFINTLIGEKAYLSMTKKVNLRQERAWFKKLISSIRAGKSISLKALHEGKLVATCEAKMGEMHDAGNVTFGLALSAPFRGKGLGRILLSTAMALAKKKWKPNHLYICYIQGNNRAKRLYKSMGFKTLAVFPRWVDHFGDRKDLVYLLFDG